MLIPIPHFKSRQSLFSLLHLLTALVVCAGSASAEVCCEQPVFDFGSKYSTEKVTHTYVLKNTGDHPISIVQVKPNCGCMIAAVSTHSIAPEQQAEICVEMSLTGRDGPQLKRILVETNDPAQPRTTLSMKGTAIDLVSATPAMLMGVRLKKGQLERRIVLTSKESYPLEIEVVNTENKRITTNVLPGSSDQEKILSINIDTESDQTTISGRIQLKTNVKMRPELTIPYRLSCNEKPFKLPSRIKQPSDQLLPPPAIIPEQPAPLSNHMNPAGPAMDKS